VSIKRKIGWILLAAFVVFWMTFGLYEPFRSWILTQGGPGAVAWWSDFSAGVTSTPFYQQWHALLYIVPTFILAYAVHQIHAANKIPLFRVQPTTVKTQKTQREPEEPESAPSPQPVEAPQEVPAS